MQPHESKIVGPNAVFEHADGARVVIHRRKADNSGWWNTDRSGFSDRAINQALTGEGGWRLVLGAVPVREEER